MSKPSTEPAKNHTALIWLIRGTGLFIVVPAAMLLAFLLVALPVMMMANAFKLPGIHEWVRIAAICFFVILALFYALMAKVGYNMFRKVDVISVANFAFIFSYIAAKDLYYLLPQTLPKFVADYLGNGSPFLGQGEDAGISYRTTLAFIAFLVFYNVSKHYLEKVLGINPPGSVQNPPLVDPDIPEFPQKSPLIQL